MERGGGGKGVGVERGGSGEVVGVERGWGYTMPIDPEGILRSTGFSFRFLDDYY